MFVTFVPRGSGAGHGWHVLGGWLRGLLRRSGLVPRALLRSLVQGQGIKGGVFRALRSATKGSALGFRSLARLAKLLYRFALVDFGYCKITGFMYAATFMQRALPAAELPLSA